MSKPKKKKIAKKKSSLVRKVNVEESGSVGSICTLRQSRFSFMATFTMEIDYALEIRNIMQAFENNDAGEKVEVTPKAITLDTHVEKFEKLLNRIQNFPLMLPQYERRSSKSMPKGNFSGTNLMESAYSGVQHQASAARMGGLRLSMEDILNSIGGSRIKLENLEETAEIRGSSKGVTVDPTIYTKPYIKVTLRKTPVIELYEQRSLIALKDTDDGDEVLLDNKQYEYLTVGKGKIRRTSEAETQTTEVLYKSREVNTMQTFIASRGVYVSYFEMFDTYKAIETGKTTIISESEGQLLAAITPLKTNMDKCNAIMKLQNFKFANMIILRLLASNEYEESQRRFRNMNMPNRMSKIVEYRYTLRVLFRFWPQSLEKERRAVADLCFCPSNGDILAVAYGIYSFSAMQVPKKGHVSIWSIKNPGDPERSYFFEVPVASVAFSPFLPTLIAIGLYDGSVQVRDITYPNDSPVAVSQRISSPGCDPVVAIKWINQSETGDAAEIDPFLTLSQDGSVTRFRIINSPYLLGFKQMVLERVEGIPEGLLVKRAGDLVQEANRRPQGLNLTMHPLYADVYYVLTDEGCLHKCSTNYQHQYLEVWKTHDGSVNTMDFSPWSPKMFLTCGNDWCVRVWIDGIFKPLLTLKSKLSPILCAQWSRTHSTVIVSINRKTFDIWDIRRNILQPVSTTNLDSSYLTMCKFSKCGRSIALGNERGNVLMCAIDDIPFPPHFQYDELEKAINKAVATVPDMIIELKSVGYFGYPNKGFVRTD